MDRRGLVAFVCMCLGIALDGCAVERAVQDGDGNLSVPARTVALGNSFASPATTGFTIAGNVTEVGRLSVMVRRVSSDSSGQIPSATVLRVSIPLTVGQSGGEVAQHLAAALKGAISPSDTTLTVAVTASSVGLATRRFSPTFFVCDGPDSCPAAVANNTDLGVTVHGLDIRTVASGDLVLPKPSLPRGLQLDVLGSPGSQATLVYSLAQRAEVSLDVFDVVGRRIRVLVSGKAPAGTHTVTWDGLDDHGTRVGNGIYFYRLVAGRSYLDRRVILVK